MNTSSVWHFSGSSTEVAASQEPSQSHAAQGGASLYNASHIHRNRTSFKYANPWSPCKYTFTGHGFFIFGVENMPPPLHPGNQDIFSCFCLSEKILRAWSYKIAYCFILSPLCSQSYLPARIFWALSSRSWKRSFQHMSIVGRIHMLAY